jgi:hypothetical protein
LGETFAKRPLLPNLCVRWHIPPTGGAQILIRLRRINPRNIQHVAVVKIFAFPRSKSGIFDLTLTKIEHFSKVSVSVFTLKDVHGDVN